jgi:hypothetical protein
VRLERFGDRDHSVADVIMVLAVICLALVTWSYLGEAASVPLWKSYASVIRAFGTCRPDPPASLGHRNEISVRRMDDRSAIFTQIF